MALSMGLLGGAGFVAPVTGPAFDLLETQVLSGSQSIVEFTGLVAKYAGDYKHLQLRVVSRSNRASTVDSIGLRFNGVTSGYAWHWIRALDSSISSTAALSETSLQLNTMQGNNGNAGAYGGCITDILDPFSTVKATTTRTFDAFLNSDESAVHLTSGAYFPTTQIDTIGLVSRAGSSIVAGSRFSIYGRRA